MANEALKLSREKALAGSNPTAVGQAKVRQALDWVYRWGWSSSSTLDSLSGAVRRGLSAKLVKLGLLQSTRTESGGAVRGVPQAILTLTKLGVSDVSRWREDLLPYEIDAYRIKQDHLRHYQLAQTATAKALADGKISNFFAEKELAQKSAAAVKQPDVLWLVSGQKVAVEVELSAKWGRDLDRFVAACVQSLTKGSGGQSRFDVLALITDSPAIRKRYLAAFEIGASYALWMKDERGFWVKTGTAKVPDWVRGQVQCRLVD